MSTTASGFTDACATAILNVLFPGTAFTKPSAFYLGVSTTNTDATGGITEPSGNGYARVNTGTAWNTPTGAGTVSSANTNLIQFPVSTGSWGTIVGWTLFDALTSGNKWTFGQLASGISVPSGRVLQFAAGEIVNQMVSASGPFKGFTDYGATQILKGLLRNVSFGAPGTWYLALSTAAVTAASGITEPSSGGYARKAITANGTNWGNASGATAVSLLNSLAVQMATLSGTWGTLQGWALFDALTSGNMWLGGQLSPTLTPTTGEAPYVPASTLSPILTSTS